jgi:hypothetical protein
VYGVAYRHRHELGFVKAEDLQKIITRVRLAEHARSAVKIYQGGFRSPWRMIG